MSRPSRRSAFTLIELLAALAGASLLLIGMSSAIFIATRAADTSRTPATATLEAHTSLSQMLADIQFAQSITEQVPTAITVVVPDRDLDTNPETIRYAWSGTPGDPLTRQYNGGMVSTVADNVHDFALDFPPTFSNLLSNADMESGTTNWEPVPGADITSSSSQYRSGAQSLNLSYLTDGVFGARQNIQGLITSGTSYDVEAWVKKTTGTAIDVDIELVINSTGEGTQSFASPASSVETTWGKVSGTVTPTWTGTVNYAYWRLTPVGGASVFYLDDAVLQQTPDGRQWIGIAVQVSSDSAARLESAVPLLNEAL